MHWHYLRDRQDQKLWQKIISSFLTLALIVTREVGSLILFLIWGNVNTGICWKNVQNFIQKGDTLQKHRLYLGCRLNYGSVAQLVERRTVNPYAAGSSPASASKNFVCRKAGFPMEEKSGLRGRQSPQYGREPRRPASLISLPLWVRFPPLQPISRMASEDVWF